MNKYELVLVLDPDLSDADRCKIVEQVEKLLQGAKGKLVKKDEWGKKELSYPLAKKTIAYFYLLSVSLEPAMVTGFEKKVKITEGILRYLLVKDTSKSSPTRVSEDKGESNGATIAK